MQGQLESDHLTIWAAETATCPYESRWLDWIQQVEKRLGKDPDGENGAEAQANGTADGYSLDEFYDMFRAGKTPAQAVQGLV